MNTGELCINSEDTSFDSVPNYAVRVEWTKDSSGRWKMEEVPGSEKFFPAQLVFLALGFLGPEADIIKALGVKQDARSNIQTPPKVRVTDN
jgi:glutamate synthase (NADH)